jgi:tetratricopeptide (TPR) repeat protein
MEVTSREQVLNTLGAAASRLRQKLGESLASIRKFDAPLPRATTAALDALHAYALALDQGRMNLRTDSIPHLERAIALDPNFAMAQAVLSGVYANTGRSADAPALSRRAFELRDRVSERERFFISWRYYVDAAQSWDKALELAQSWTTTYRKDAFAFNSLGIAFGAFGRHGEAVDSFREALRIDARFTPPYGNLAGSLIALNRFGEAKSLLDTGARGIDAASLRRAAHLLAFLDGDAAAMTAERDFTNVAASPESSLVWPARTSVFSGRVRAAHDLFQRAAETVRRNGSRELAAQWTMEDAESHAIAGQCPEALRESSAGLELSRDNFTLERAGRTLALCGAAGADTLSSELATRFPAATLTARIQLPVIAAELALQHGDAARALQLLDPVKPYDRAPSSEFWPAYLRGQAYLKANDGRGAAEQFRSIVDHRGAAPTSALYPLAHLGLARASVMTGDVALARGAYETLFSVWKDADSELQPLGEARAEYARLR